LLLVASALGVSACRTVPIVEFRNQALLTSSGRTPTLDEVRRAIVTAATSLGWTLYPAGEQGFICTLVVREKHMIVVDATYSVNMLSVTYRDSTNMSYWSDGSSVVIHQNYNVWTRTLTDKIRGEIVKL